MSLNLTLPKNDRYAAVVVKINTLVELEGMKTVQGAIIFGSHIIVGKDTKIGDIGIYFPIETRLSNEYLKNNNLYQDQTKNSDSDKRGYFGDSGRVRCCKFASKYRSEGFFMPIDSLSFVLSSVELLSLKEGDTFDELKGIKICEKYIPLNAKNPNNGTNKQKKAVKINMIVDDQFRFHLDTGFLARDVNSIDPEDIVSGSQKLHGTSFVAGRLLVKEPTWQQKLAVKIPSFKSKNKKKQKLYAPLNRIFGTISNYLSSFISDTSYYDLIYSSRKVIKNAFINANPSHYYDTDIWGLVASELKDIIPNGITLYGEIVGFLPSGKAIQSCSEGDFDYGCAAGTHEKYIYRITFTNNEGRVFEFSWKQMEEFCAFYGLKTPPLFFYGKAKDMFPELDVTNHWHENFLAALEAKFMLDQDCPLCYNKVPFEGIVISIDSLFNKRSLKLKTFRFRSKETLQNDAGIVDMETAESEGYEDVE